MTSKATVQSMIDTYNRITGTQEAADNPLIVMLAQPRTDGPALIERLYQAARNEYYRSNCQTDLDDAFQTMTAHASAALLDAPELTAESYAYIINKARWTMRDEQRHARRTNASATYSLDAAPGHGMDDAHELDAEDLASTAIDDAITAMDLQDALAKLSDAQRQTFVLRWTYGLDHAEIAEIMGISRNASHQYTKHAKTALRKHLPHRAPAKPDYTRMTVRKFAGLKATAWTSARSEDGTRVIKSATKTAKFHRMLVTYGNNETAEMDHRKTVQVMLATADQLTTTDAPERHARTSSPDAPAPTQATRPARWTEYNYPEVYNFSDLDEMTGEPRQRQTRIPDRPTWNTNDARLTCYNWNQFQVMDGTQPAPDMDAPAPDDAAKWLAEYNASI